MKKLDFIKKQTVSSKVVDKRFFQELLKQVRSSGYKVVKLDAGYTVSAITPNGGEILILKAMNGSKGYLVRFDTNALSL